MRAVHVDDLALPLRSGDVSDWNVCDWYCVKALGPFVVAGSDTEARARAIASWSHADGLWQRRAGAVAFVNHAASRPEIFDGFSALLLEVCETNASDGRRWSQTSVGWVLRELSRQEPEVVSEFLRTHPELSTEAVRNAGKYLT